MAAKLFEQYSKNNPNSVFSAETAAKIREWINKNPLPTAIGVAVVVLLCIVFVYVSMWTSSPTVVKSVYFYDLDTGKLFAGPNDSLPPIAAPSGKKSADGQDIGVRAYVFSCGDCSDQGKRYIGYLETFTADAREALSKYMPPKGGAAPNPMQMGSLMATGRMVRDGEAKGEWVGIDSPEGREIVKGSMTHCSDGKFPPQCFP